jgi:putative holliday junction resolvase
MAETVLAFDFGLKRVGVAVGESLVGTSRPLKAIFVPTPQVLDAISPLVDEWQPQKFVVGRPTHPDGAPHAMTARCERFSRQLAARFRRPVELVDERYSSVDAAQRVKKSAAAGAIDSEAAAILLERYFESHPRR